MGDFFGKTFFGKSTVGDIFRLLKCGIDAARRVTHKNTTFGGCNGISLHIIGCPDFTKDTNYLGHFINDGSKSDFAESSLKSNCRFYHLKDLLVAIIATKNIKKDEEFYITYGIEYWESYNKRKLEKAPESGPNSSSLREAVVRQRH